MSLLCLRPDGPKTFSRAAPPLLPPACISWSPFQKGNFQISSSKMETPRVIQSDVSGGTRSCNFPDSRRIRTSQPFNTAKLTLGLLNLISSIIGLVFACRDHGLLLPRIVYLPLVGHLPVVSLPLHVCILLNARSTGLSNTINSPCCPFYGTWLSISYLYARKRV